MTTGLADLARSCTPEELQAKIDQVTEGWSEQQKNALYQRLKREARRSRISREYPSAGALACYVDPTTKQTPALTVIDQALERAFTVRGSRTVITMPPQEGKSTRVTVWGSLRALQLDPDRRIVAVSFAESLIAEHSRTARNIIAEHGSEARDPITGLAMPDKLGLALADDKSAAHHWAVQGHSGGMYSAGIHGGVTGRPADLLIIDDPFSGMEEADSATMRAKVITFWQSTARTRLAAGAPVILVQTRWHEKDLAGHLLALDKLRAPGERRWNVVNIPAVSDGKTPDALGRPPGVFMESARGRTVDDWSETREDVGPRTWAALYQGVPTPIGGGLFSTDWFDRHRLQSAEGAVYRLISIDPAETGKRDEAGLLALASTSDGRVLVTDDRSGRMTSDVWARRAVLLALEVGATEIMFEAYTTEQTYTRTIRQAWSEIRDQARLLRRHLGDISAAAAELATWPDHPADTLDAIAELAELRIPDQDQIPFLIHPHRGKGDKVARSIGARQAASTGRLRMVGTHPELETQAATWQVGQDSPDRVDALSNGYNRLMELIGQPSSIAVPGGQAGGDEDPNAIDLLGGFGSGSISLSDQA